MDLIDATRTQPTRGVKHWCWADTICIVLLIVVAAQLLANRDLVVPLRDSASSAVSYFAYSDQLVWNRARLVIRNRDEFNERWDQVICLLEQPALLEKRSMRLLMADPFQQCYGALIFDEEEEYDEYIAEATALSSRRTLRQGEKS